MGMGCMEEVAPGLDLAGQVRVGWALAAMATWEVVPGKHCLFVSQGCSSCALPAEKLRELFQQLPLVLCSNSSINATKQSFIWMKTSQQTWMSEVMPTIHRLMLRPWPYRNVCTAAGQCIYKDVRSEVNQKPLDNLRSILNELQWVLQLWFSSRAFFRVGSQWVEHSRVN